MHRERAILAWSLLARRRFPSLPLVQQIQRQPESPKNESNSLLAPTFSHRARTNASPGERYITPERVPPKPAKILGLCDSQTSGRLGRCAKAGSRAARRAARATTASQTRPTVLVDRMQARQAGPRRNHVCVVASIWDRGSFGLSRRTTSPPREQGSSSASVSLASGFLVRNRATKGREARKNAPLGRSLGRAAGSSKTGRSQIRCVTAMSSIRLIYRRRRAEANATIPNAAAVPGVGGVNEKEAKFTTSYATEG